MYNMKRFLILFISTIIFMGCSETVTKTVHTNIDLSSEKIGNLPITTGIQKVKIDSIYYIIVISASGGVGIIKHK